MEFSLFYYLGVAFVLEFLKNFGFNGFGGEVK